jgi:hypothetical protein
MLFRKSNQNNCFNYKQNFSNIDLFETVLLELQPIQNHIKQAILILES